MSYIASPLEDRAIDAWGGGAPGKPVPIHKTPFFVSDGIPDGYQEYGRFETSGKVLFILTVPQTDTEEKLRAE